MDLQTPMGSGLNINFQNPRKIIHIFNTYMYMWSMRNIPLCSEIRPNWNRSNSKKYARFKLSFQPFSNIENWTDNDENNFVVFICFINKMPSELSLSYIQAINWIKLFKYLCRQSKNYHFVTLKLPTFFFNCSNFFISGNCQSLDNNQNKLLGLRWM